MTKEEKALIETAIAMLILKMGFQILETMSKAMNPRPLTKDERRVGKIDRRVTNNTRENLGRRHSSGRRPDDADRAAIRNETQYSTGAHQP